GGHQEDGGVAGDAPQKLGPLQGVEGGRHALGRAGGGFDQHQVAAHMGGEDKLAEGQPGPLHPIGGRLLAGKDVPVAAARHRLLHQAQLLDVPGDGRLGDLDALLPEELSQLLLGADVPLADNLEDRCLAPPFHTVPPPPGTNYSSGRRRPPPSAGGWTAARIRASSGGGQAEPAAGRSQRKNSRFPAGPRRGDGVSPWTARPTVRAASHTFSITWRWTWGERTTPPFPTASRPASNWGLTRMTRWPSGLRKVRSRSRKRVTEMKETSTVTRSTASGMASRSRWRMLVRSSTTTRESCRSFQASWP